MRVLTFSTLYPNEAQPSHGIFVEQRLRELLAACPEIAAEVVAPVPWFPSRNPAFGSYATFARVPREERRDGLRVEHPRYVVVPKVGMTLAPMLLAAGVFAALDRVRRSGFEFDLIDAHFLYPDGVAAVWLARRFGVPVVLTARGTDVNLYPRLAIPRRLILWAVRNASRVVTVCEALRAELLSLGVDPGQVVTLRNGVDLVSFAPVDRAAERRALGFDRRTLLSVGHLIPRKGHDRVVRAAAMLPDTDLVVIGAGPERARLVALARELGIDDRVRMVDPVAQPTLRRYYGAADALVLASSREGWANVLLESMACGTPVVASAIWGTPEVVAAPEAGVLFDALDPNAIRDGVERLFDAYPDRAATRRYAERFDWSATSLGQRDLFRAVVETHRAS